MVIINSYVLLLKLTFKVNYNLVLSYFFILFGLKGTISCFATKSHKLIKSSHFTKIYLVIFTPLIWEILGIPRNNRYYFVNTSRCKFVFFYNVLKITENGIQVLRRGLVWQSLGLPPNSYSFSWHPAPSPVTPKLSAYSTLFI